MLKTPSTLAELVAPLSEAEFRTLLRERRLTLLRGSNSERYGTLLNWDLLVGMIERGEHPRSLADISLSRESITVPPDRWLMKNPEGSGNKVDVAKVEAYLAHGFSLVVTRIDAYAPQLATLCDDIRSRSFEQIKVGVIVTTGRAGAFKLHYDPEDLVILQVEGSKRWKIYGPAVSHPVIGMPEQLPPPEDVPIFDEVLHPGDFLFVPGGNWHRCENGPARSLHLGIFFLPPTGWHFIKALTSELVSDEMFRTPLTRLGGALELAKLEADFKIRAIENINRLKLNEFFADWIKAHGS
jgi:hypothetical protein